MPLYRVTCPFMVSFRPVLQVLALIGAMLQVADLANVKPYN